MEENYWLTYTKMKQKLMQKEIELKENIVAKLDGKMLAIKGTKGEIKKKFNNPTIKIAIQNNKIILSADNATKRDKTMMGTFSAHIRNMMRGVLEGFVYRLKICSGHFPMNVSVENQNVLIKNFLGERVPRKAKVLPGAKVSIQGDIITVEGIDKEMVSQSASNIELACRVSNRDRRVFMDGVWLITKDGKNIK